MSEVLLTVEFMAPQSANGYAGSLTRGDVDELNEWMETWNDEPTAT